MADDLKNRGPADAARVNVHESWELAHWTKKFGVDADALKAAVKAVGPMVRDVEQYLRGQAPV